MAEGIGPLVERARAGDLQAVAGLFERYRIRVVRFCLTFAPIREPDAHDITQETFMRVFRGIRGLKEASRFESWLFSIARHRCLTFLRKAHRCRQGGIRLALEQGTVSFVDREDTRMKKMERAIVAEEIERLPDSLLKEAGQMFYLQGLDTGVIAERMGAPVSTVTTWLSRFRLRIRHRLVLRILALRGHETGEMP